MCLCEAKRSKAKIVRSHSSSEAALESILEQCSWEKDAGSWSGLPTLFMNPYKKCKCYSEALFCIIKSERQSSLVADRKDTKWTGKKLEIESLTKYYGKKENITKALNGISFQVVDSEFIGIMGSSGSGKTTLLNCISKASNPTGGRIL